MFIKIYFKDKPLFLCDAIDATMQTYVHHDDAVFIDELNSHSVKAMIHEMEQPSIHAGVFYHPHLDELKEAFFKKFNIVMAAGGLVRNEKNELLLIFRRGKWDLPKGKCEKNEKFDACALREVKEETGLKNVKLKDQFATSWHTYHEGTHFNLKESRWWLMEAGGEQELIPQTEEDILEIRWVLPKDLQKYRSETFPSVIDVLDGYLSRS